MSLTPSQKAFAISREPFPAFVGGFGCVRDSTEIATPMGFVCVADLPAGGDVLSWSETDHVFQHAPASGSFPKGKANLYRVITARGEFVASGHHRVRVQSGSYQPVEVLRAGMALSGCGLSLQPTRAGLDRIWSPEGDRNYWQTLAGYLGDCAGGANQCDPRLRQVVDSALAFSQLRADVHKSGQCSSQGVSAQCSTIKTPIISIERLLSKEWYWDLHVAGNNNYITKDGVIHHNSGKTAAAIARAMALKTHFKQADIAYYLPTFPLVEDIAMRRFPELCERKGWAFKTRGGTSPHIEFPGAGRILFRSMSNPAAIVGYEVAHSICDELDTLPTELARQIWVKVIARNRQKIGDFPNTVGVATTPEGFRFVWERWVKNKAPGYALFKAKTEDNAANLPSGYIENLRNSYPTALLSAYLDGEFVNLTAGSVYTSYDRLLNGTTERIKPNEPLHIGMDFNVSHGAAAVHVLREGKPFALDELTDVFDTPAMIGLIQKRFDGHPIFIYPDASGGNRKSNNASQSDISLLKAARFTVCNNPANPAVKDRVLSMGKIIEARDYRVNPDTCPSLVEGLEKQAYNKYGEPDKTGGLDHILDAAGYFVAYKFPLTAKPAMSINLGAARLG